MFLQQFANGLIIGSLYTLVALGLTLVFGSLRIPHFAHGAVFMVGAFISYYGTSKLQLPFILAILLSIIITSIVGVLLEFLFYRPLQGKDEFTFLIAALAAMIIISSLGFMFFGTQSQIIPSPFSTEILNFAGIVLPVSWVQVFVISIVFIILLMLLINKTKIGRSIRASAQNPGAARLVGVSPGKVATMTFIIGSALAAISGTMFGVLFPFTPAIGDIVIMKAFIIVVLGGMGSIAGSVIGGLILGLLESLGGAYISTNWTGTIAFVLLILFLMVKPSGLFGKDVSH
ncbi:branched-chain amino acid ABC transporter permease [Bacillus sp. FJAT-29953]|nr:branched-chain amino acid ABC transporter permease [Bacillus sp. FJAT-29953]